MKKSIKFFVILFMLIFVNSSFAQFRMSIGPALGLNFNLHYGSDIDEGGSGFGMVFTAQIDMTFNRDRSLGILTTMAFYDNRSGSTSQTASQNQGGQVVSFNIDNDVSISYFQLETMFKYRIPGVGVYFLFGPALGFNLSAELESEVTITTPGYYFQGGQQSQKSKETLKNTNTRFALAAGSGIDIRLSNLITLSPQLTFRYGISDVIEDVSYKILTFQAVVACKFNIL